MVSLAMPLAVLLSVTMTVAGCHVLLDRMQKEQTRYRLN
jgi:hypothetical protein